MAKLPKLIDLDVSETSGVDHPAHLQEGWIVMKAADPSVVSDALDRIRAIQNESKESFVENVELADALAETQEALAKANERIAELESLAVVEVDETAEILKSMPEPVVKMLADARSEAEEALAKARETEAQLNAEREARANEAAIAKAAEWSNLQIDAQNLGPALRRLSELDAELAKSVEEALSVANSQAESAGMFAELGKSTQPAAGSAYGELTALAKAAVESGVASTFEQAIAVVAGTNPDLYARYTAEKAR